MQLKKRPLLVVVQALQKETVRAISPAGSTGKEGRGEWASRVARLKWGKTSGSTHRVSELGLCAVCLLGKLPWLLGLSAFCLVASGLLVCWPHGPLRKSRRGLPRPDRGHHVPALTVTNGGRGVGSEVAFLVKCSRERERLGIQDVVALIPETEAWTLRVRKKIPVWTSKVYLQNSVVRFRWPAGGCRFGSALGRSWGFVARCLWSALPVQCLF